LKSLSAAADLGSVELISVTAAARDGYDSNSSLDAKYANYFFS